MKTVTERFLTYVKHHTTSDETSDTFPSTKRQLALQRNVKQSVCNPSLWMPMAM